jgi:hypothetical protein
MTSALAQRHERVSAARLGCLIGAIVWTAAPAGLAAKEWQPTVDYKAERVITAGEEAETLRVFYSAGKERLDRVGDDNDDRSDIVRRDRGVVWYLLNRDKVYVEVPIEESEITENPWGDKTTLTRVGPDTLDGAPAVRFRITGEIDGSLWLSNENVPLRIVGVGQEEGVRYNFRFEQRNIVVGPLAPTLFEIPAGYRKIKPGEPARAAQPAKSR